MECQPSDSKKLFKVFDASKRKRARKKREGDDSNSVATDDSTGIGLGNGRRLSSTKASLQDITIVPDGDGSQDNITKRERDSSPSMPRSPGARRARSPRRHRRIAREGISLALKAGMVSTPRDLSPCPQDKDDVIGTIPQDQDSFIYAFLEEAIKRDKKKHRHSKRHEVREASPCKEKHHHRRHRDETRDRDRDRDKTHKADPAKIDQTALLETFAKLCAQMNQKSTVSPIVNEVPRAHSHKSLQCEVLSKRESIEVEHKPVARSPNYSTDNLSPSRIRSHDRLRNVDRSTVNINRNDKCDCCEPYERQPRYASKANIELPKRYYEDDRYEYPPHNTATRSCINGPYKNPPLDAKDNRSYGENRRKCEERRYSCEQRASRSFDMQRESYIDDVSYRRTSRSDGVKDKRYEDRLCKDRKHEERCARDKYYDTKDVRQKNYATLPAKSHCSRRNLEKFEKMSVDSREDYRYRDRDRYSERERDSGLSVADGDETSTVSGRSNYLRVVKQEITEQREAMDKMMKLWKELMRCFKGVSQSPGTDKTNESADSMRESAAAQLRLWRECMRRYETVARDVGDTDARLMVNVSWQPVPACGKQADGPSDVKQSPSLCRHEQHEMCYQCVATRKILCERLKRQQCVVSQQEIYEEINKQRSEMAEMASMWQECLQRYRDMSNDFNNLKQQLATSESPTRPPAPPAPPAPTLACAEGEGPAAPHYRLPHNYPPMPPIHPGYPGGSPLRSRASAPPAWWWAGEEVSPPRRRSSQESRGSRDRRHRHKDRDRDDLRGKAKCKPSGARSEHKHRKR